MDDQGTSPHTPIFIDTVARLHDCLEDVATYKRLYGIVHTYLIKAQLLSSQEDDHEIVDDFFQRVVLKTLELARSKDVPNIQAWFLCVAQKLLLQERAERMKRGSHEKLISQLGQDSSAPSQNWGECFDVCAAITLEDAVTTIDETRIQLRWALERLAPDDQEIINLTMNYGFRHEEIARILHITPGAARVRYSRALHRLRAAWDTHDNDKRGDRHE
ncbi:MAG: sigma-70 family RNA polymerase sigma factor [Ktedonobacteraceae bacterium]|nr:sigma-70 family RNA polymerase sigma factor [Ktedonobacteraceae bacterium]